MTFVWIETEESRRRTEGFNPSDNTAELAWAGFGSRDDFDAETALQAIMPTTFRGLPLRTWQYECVGGDNWTARANYNNKEKAEPPDTGEQVFSFDTTGGTVHVTQARAQTNYAGAGSTAPNYKGAIGVGKNNAVEGVDIVSPSLQFSLTYRMLLADLSLGYVRILYELTGSTNNGLWKGFARGELLFMGAQGKQGTSTDPEVTYNFAAIKNTTAIAVGDSITVASKRGHEYMWVHYEDVDDTDAKLLVAQPKSAHVAQVYPESNFALLGIGS